MHMLADNLLAGLPKNIANVPTIRANGRKTPYHTLTINDQAVTCALKPLVGLLRSLCGRMIEVSIHSRGWLVITTGTMKATLYDLEHPCIDDELQQARKAWQEARDSIPTEPNQWLPLDPKWLAFVARMIDSERTFAALREEKVIQRKIIADAELDEWLRIRQLARGLRENEQCRVYDPPERTDAERDRMFEAFAEPPKVTINH